MTAQIVQFLIYATYLGISLFVLVRGADLFLSKAKQIGASLGLSHFAIGILIVAFGTSLPELATSLFSVVGGHAEIVVANVIGSNVTNILLIVGLLAVISGKIAVDHTLVKTELPIFFISTALFAVMVSDGTVDRLEGMLLLGTFCTYLWYLFFETDLKRSEPARELMPPLFAQKFRTYFYALFGLSGLVIGAHYTIEMVGSIAGLFSVPVSIVAVLALAVGTSLPEFFVSLQAMRNGEAELAIGNIFGSNAFNLLVVVGLPSLIVPLSSTGAILTVGLPVLIASSAVFFVTGFSKQIMRWEGMMMLLFFIFFIVKLMTFV